MADWKQPVIACKWNLQESEGKREVNKILKLSSSKIITMTEKSDGLRPLIDSCRVVLACLL